MDAVLGNAILKMSVDATKGGLLVRVVACLFEGIVGELPIVAVVMQNFDTVLGGEGLEGTFGGEGLN